MCGVFFNLPFVRFRFKLRHFKSGFQLINWMQKEKLQSKDLHKYKTSTEYFTKK